MNLNKVFLIGNMTRDPELRTLPSGNSVVNFAIATNRAWKNKDGEKQQDTQFHNVVAFGKLGDIIKQYLTKGSLILIEGRIQTRKWQAKDGTNRYTTEIVADAMQMGPRGGSASAPQDNSQTQPPQEEKLATIEYPEENINPEDIPF